MMLLEGGLRIGVDPMRQAEDFVACSLDGSSETGLVVLVRRGGASGGELWHAVSWAGCGPWVASA